MTTLAQRPAATASTTGVSDWLLLIVPGAIWGTSFLFIAEGLRSIGPAGVTFVRILVGLAIGMLGAVLIALPSFNEGQSSAIGVLLILAAVICYGFVLPIAVPLQQRHGALAVIWRAQAVALVLTAPLGLPDLLAAQWTLVPLLSLLALGAFGTAIAYVVLTISAARVGPTRASATTFLIPGVSLGLGVALRGEHVAALAVLGAAICIAGAVIIRRARAQH